MVQPACGGAAVSGSGNITIQVEAGFANVSPHGFHYYAEQFLQCFDNFQPPQSYSPVPYYLLCRVIELELKARHLLTKNQEAVKKDYWHDLVACYKGLQSEHKKLTAGELAVLKAANEIYDKPKGFEYFSLAQTGGNFKLPDVKVLEQIARELVNSFADN
jgi:hypothetical protein